MNSAYVIPLDTLDLSLLPNTYPPRREVTPLWSWNKSNEICEFYIHNTAPVEDESVKEETMQSLEIRTTVCHICKIDVPIQFLRDHRASPKHKAHLKIVNAAIQRMSDEVNNEMPVETEKDSLTYFCSHCVAVVQFNDRKKHDNSTNHTNAVFLDKYLCDFLDFYANSKTEDNEIETVDTNSSKILNAIENKLKNDVSASKNGNNFDLNFYLNVLRSKYKMATKIKVIDNERLEIDIDSSKIELDSSNFYGIKKMNSIDGFVECVVCKDVISESDKFEHMMGARHMYRVSTPMKDIHCRREIYPLWHHCVLCNIIISDYKDHWLSDEHKRHLEQSLKYHNSNESSVKSSEKWTTVEKIKKDQLNGNKYNDLRGSSTNSLQSNEIASKTKLCTHCNTEITTKNMKKHTNTAKHMWNTVSNYHYLFHINTSVCRVCLVDVDGPNNFESHKQSDQHVVKYKELLAANKLRIIDENEFFCMLCIKVVLIRNELCHINSQNHKKHDEDNDADVDGYYCNICDVTLTKNDANIQTHNEGKLHLKNLSNQSNKTLSNDSQQTTGDPSVTECTICNIMVATDESSHNMHLKDFHHINNHKKLLRDNHMVMQENDIYCHACKVRVSHNTDIMHARGKKHLQNLHLLSSSDVENQSKSNTSPNVDDTANTESDVNVNEIETNVPKNVKERIINEPKVNKSRTRFYELYHSLSGSDIAIDLEHYEETESPTEVLCKICKVKVPFKVSNISDHFYGNKHKKNCLDSLFESPGSSKS